MENTSLLSQVTDEEFIKLVNESSTVTELIKKIGYSTASGDLRKKIDERCNRLNITPNKKIIKSVLTSTKGDLFASRSNWQSARSNIQRIARKTYFENNPHPCCVVCGYNKQIEVAHIKAVSEFEDSAIIAEIDNINNLVALCPNHHWEFDNGYLKYNYETKQFEDTGKEPEIKVEFVNDKYVRKELLKTHKRKDRNQNGLTDAQQKVRDKQHQVSKCPGKETLENDLQSLSLVQIGKKYGVSDNSVRKWCIRLGIDFKSYGRHQIQVQREIEDNYQIEQYTLDEKYIKTFNGFKEIYQFVIDNNLSKAKKTTSFSDIKSRINEVIKGRKKSCYGFKWKLK